MTCTSAIVFYFFKPAECHLLPLPCFAEDCEDDSDEDCEDDSDEDS